MANDEQLMLEFQRGSSEAFTELFQRYLDPLYGFFRRRLDDPARAEELTQETFLAVLRGAARYEPRALFRTYLYAIALNLVSAERRRYRVEMSNPVQEADCAVKYEPDLGLCMQRAVEQLDPSQREVLLLREYEQLSYAEISEVLRIPLNTVRSRLFRARMALKILLSPEPRSARGNLDE